MSVTPRMLGTRRRQIVVLASGVCLLTFLVPLLVMNPPILGRADWSAAEVLAEIHASAPPERLEPTDIRVVEGKLLVLYLSLAFVGIAAAGYPSRAVIQVCAILALACGVGEMTGRSFYGARWPVLQPLGFSFTARIHAQTHGFVIAGFMALVVIVCHWKELDDPAAS